MALILLFSGTFAFGQCSFLDQHISYSASNTTVEEAIRELSTLHNFTVNYPSGLFGTERYNIQVKDQKIQTVIRNLCRRSNVEFVCMGENALTFRAKAELAQNVFSGFILDSSSKQPVSSALVVLNNNWVETDADGYFQLIIERLPAYIQVFAPGFKSGYYAIHNIEPSPEQIFLTPDNELGTTIVDIYDSILMVSRTGGININMYELSKIPSIAGSPGILNSLRFLPSIQSTVEVNGGMVVQGGGKDQNLVLFDGMELYNPMHLFGLFSVFDENSIHNISFYKNSFPAQYGGRLSSVLDVKSKEGDYQKWNYKLNVNPVLLEASVDGPLIKGKTSFLFSGRRSFTDFFPLFYEQIQKQNELSRFKYYFYDFTATVNHKASEKTQLYLTSYLGGDKGYIKENSASPEGINVSENENDFFVQSNLLVTGGIKTRITNTVSLHAKAGYTRYGFNHENRYELLLGDKGAPIFNRETILSYKSLISDWKTGVYIKTLPRSNNHFLMGLENVWHNFSPSNSHYYYKGNDLIEYDTVFKVRNSNILEQRYFVEDVYAKKGVRIMGGLHFVNFSNEVSYTSFQPRFNVSFNVKSKNKVEVGYAKTSQFMLQVPNNLLGIPIDIWIPADDKIMPMHCYHYSGGLTRKLGKSSVLKIDAFYKVFQNVIEYKNGVSDFIAEWDAALWSGKGRSKGVGMMLKKEKGRFNGWLGYTISRSERSIEGLNEGAWFPFQYDRTHDIKCVLHYQFNQNLTLGATWSFASGNYLTAPEVHYLLNVEGRQYLIEQYGSKNNLRLPDYHRLDFGFHHKKKIGTALQTWSFTVYNVYNRQNVFYVNSSLNSSGGINFQPVSILPILPSVNYAIEF